MAVRNDDNVLSIYLKEINKIPLLSYEEETELALKAQKGDVAAKNKIVNANLRFVVNVAKKYQNHAVKEKKHIKEIQAKQTIVDSILEVILKSIWDVHRRNTG